MAVDVAHSYVIKALHLTLVPHINYIPGYAKLISYSISRPFFNWVQLELSSGTGGIVYHCQSLIRSLCLLWVVYLAQS